MTFFADFVEAMADAICETCMNRWEKRVQVKLGYVIIKFIKKLLI